MVTESAHVSASEADGDKPASSRPGNVGRIPVRNLWLLMFYASDLFRERGRGNTALEESPDDLPDLIAEILAHAVEQRKRRHLSMGYRSRHDVIHRVRGRIDVLTTECRQLLSARSSSLPVRGTLHRHPTQSVRPRRPRQDRSPRYGRGCGAPLPYVSQHHEDAWGSEALHRHWQR